MSSLRKGFTLIELLVVIAIIAILAIVVILTLNPIELLRQSRDSNRVSDMSTLADAFGLYSEDVGGSMGLVSTTYVSISDPSATTTAGDQCQGLGLAALPSGDTYHCPASSTLRSIGGLGWIPLNFNNFTFKTPLAVLPVDPINTTSSGLYYTYTTDGTHYELTHAMESNKYSGLCANDSGQYSDLCELGTNLTLAELDYYSAGQPGRIAFSTPVNVSSSATTSITYVFSGTAGQVVNLVATNNTYGGCGAGFGILNPDGTTLVGGSTVCSTVISQETLTQTGTTTVYLSPGGASGSVTLTLTQNQTGGTIVANSSTTVSNSVVGQNIQLTFSGTSGEVVNLVANNNTYGGCGAGYTILNPNGTSLVGGSTVCNNLIANQTLGTTGTYTILVTTGSLTGSANLTLSQNQTGGTIALNSPVAVSNTLVGQNILLTFSGTSGQIVMLTPTSNAYGGCGASFGIMNPNGTTLAQSTTVCNGPISSSTLGTTGTYTVFIYPGATTGGVTMTLAP